VTAGRVLVFNAGSATLKATVLDRPDPAPRFDRTIDWDSASGTDPAALDGMLEAIADAGIARDSIDVVGHRVVHGGERFVGPTLVDDEVLAALDGLADLAPLHNPVAIATIRVARERLPRVRHVADFDTAFHATLPIVARRYPVPDDWVADHGIRRFGFHGLSVEWSVGRAADLLGRPPTELRIVVAHLGGGCSVTAVDGGRSVDTSMGLTPMEGLMMVTRSGSIDPGIVFRLLRSGVDRDEIERTLDRGSGLLGVGGSGDMRRLLELADGGDARAGLAIDLFVRRATAGIAAAASALPALDALVFSGGIGEHATTVRARICAGLGLLGVPIPDDRAVDRDAVLARAPGGTAVLSVHAREDVVIADRALATVREQDGPRPGRSAIV
jgi:acetate kinase